MNQERQLVRGHRVILLLDYKYYCTNPILNKVTRDRVFTPDLRKKYADELADLRLNNREV